MTQQAAAIARKAAKAFHNAHGPVAVAIGNAARELKLSDSKHDYIAEVLDALGRLMPPGVTIWNIQGVRRHHEVENLLIEASEILDLFG
jgi:hypothetical protein